MSASIRSGNEQDDELYFMQQHYGIATRLLDWTTNPLIALFFACWEDPKARNSNESEQPIDGRLYYLDAYELVGRKVAGDNPFGIADSRNPYLRSWMEHIFNWREPQDLKTELRK
jgi:FRG domain-containing protein